jgi:hypothetical protein
MSKTAALIALFLMTGFVAKAGLLLPGEVAIYSFTTNPVIFPCSGGCDTLLLSNLASAASPSVFTARLFNGATLLGTNIGLCCVFGFVSATSLFTFGPPTVVDFTSILNGSIAGHIDVTIDTGSVDLVQSGISLFLAHAINSSGTIGNSQPSATLTGMTIISASPEPSSLALGVLGSAFLLLLTNRRNQLCRRARLPHSS